MTASTTAESIRKLSDSDVVRLEGALAVQRGKPILFTAARAQDVVRQSKVDIYDPKTERGYQRDPSASRIRGAAHYYGDQKGRMPNALLVNIRQADFPSVRVVVTGGDQEDYHAAIESGGEWLGAGYIEFPRDLSIWIYDGQHREGGIGLVLSEGRLDGTFPDFPVPLSISLGLDDVEEMREFYMVNTNAKSVKTDLAWELLRKMAEDDPELAEELEMSGQDWVIRGIEVSRALQEFDGPWRDCIQLPNEKRLRSDRLTIPQSQFVRSLKPVLDMPLLSKADPDKVAQIIDAYWQGIAEVLPEPFDPANSPKDWVLQKGQGAIALHRALPRVIEVVRARGGRLADPDAYAEVMKPLAGLKGEVTDEETSEPYAVSGSDFWLSGPKGVASGYSGDAGRRRLAIMVQALLPRPSEELLL